MTKYPNRDALRQANDIYLDCMRPFVIRHLKQVPGKMVEDLVAEALTNEQIGKFWGKLDEDDDIESAIDFSYFPLIVKNNWSIIQNERNYGFARRFNEDMDVQSMLWLIRKGRNSCEHRGTKDLDSEFVRINLFHLADVLGKINRPDQQREVEVIRDELFSDDTAERLAEAKEHLKAAESEKIKYKKSLAEAEERLEVDLKQLADAKDGKVDLEKRLKATSNRLEEVKAEKVEYENRFKTASHQLVPLKAVKAKLEERFETTSARLAEVESELTACKEHLTRTLRQLAAAEAEKAEYKESLAEIEEYLPAAVVEDTEYEDDFAEIEEHLPLGDNVPDSVTFQGTTFTRHSNKYHVTEDDISQGFWHYWHSQGREGKQEMRDAGWGVERVDGDWEVTISPVDFQAWIEDEVMELSSLLNSSQGEEPSTQPPRAFYGRTVLPTGKEMEQPALRVLADGKEHRRVKIIDYLTKHFSLTDDERSYLSKTGQAEKHLVNKGLIERTRTGYYRITARGRRKVRTK